MSLVNALRRSTRLSTEFQQQQAAASKADALASVEPRTVYRELSAISQANFTALPAQAAPQSLWGVSKARLAMLQDLHDRHARDNDRLLVVREALGSLTKPELAALMHLSSIEGLNHTSSHIIADRNRQNQYYGGEEFDRDLRLARYIENAEIELALGATPEETRQFYNNLKFFPTITAHPTKDKGVQGELLYRGKHGIADEVPVEQRRAAFEHNDREMLGTRLTPDKKDDLAAETEDALAWQAIIQRGTLNWLEDKQEALDAVYGRGVIDFMADNMNIDVATRRWQGGDADGKPIPAPVLFVLRMKGARVAVKEYLEIFGDHEQLQAERKVFEKFDEKLDALYTNIEEIEASASDSEVYLNARQQFEDIFTKTPYKGEVPGRGPDLTRQVMRSLKQKVPGLLANDATVEAGRAARRVVMMHKQVGIALGKQEIRHNGEDYKKIFENLYDHLRENNLVPLPPHIKKFSDMDAKGQAVFLKRLIHEHGDKMKGWFFEANPVSKEGGWSREILERFEVIRTCYNHRRMGFAIIAEADASSAVLQQALADSFGIKNMVHCPLNESEQTIAKAAEAMRSYSRVFGAKNLISKIDQASDGETVPLFFAVMDPQSDSQKSYGFSIKFLQRATDQDLIRTAIKPVLDSIDHEAINGDRAKLEGVFVGILRKIGTGASYARGGFSPKAVPRMFISALSEMPGIDINNIDPKMRPVLKQMVSFVSTTIQGRDIGMRMGSEQEVQDLIEDVERECRMACLAIDGKIDPALIVKPASKYSAAMKASIERNAKHARDSYYMMRTERSTSRNPNDFNKLKLDLYMERVAALIVAEHTNVGARKDARKDGTKTKRVEKKSVSTLRAIGSNGASVNAESLFDGSYSLGKFLSGFHADLKAGQIAQADLYDLAHDPFFTQQTLPNVMSALAAADYEHGFDDLAGDGPEWTVKRLVTLKNSKWEVKGADGKMKKLDEITKFHAKLAYDALRATAMMEALLDTPEPVKGMKGQLRKLWQTGGAPLKGFDQSEENMIYALYRPEDRLNKLKFGPKTKDLYPHIKDTQDLAQVKRLSRAIVHETERRVDLLETDPENPQAINPENKEDKSLLYDIANGRRHHGPINIQNNLDQSGLGANPVRLMDRVVARYPAAQKARKLARTRNFEFTNDNLPNLGYYERVN
jgi:hypothetical protein